MIQDSTSQNSDSQDQARAALRDKRQFKGTFKRLDGSQVEVVFTLPTRAISNQAFEMVKPHESGSAKVLMSEAEMMITRLCIKSINGEPMSFLKLQGSLIDRYLMTTEQAAINEVILDKITAKESEVQAALASSEMIFDEECQKTSVYKRRLTFDVGFGSRKIVIVVPNRRIMHACIQNAEAFDARSKLIVMTEELKNYVRWCLVSLDDKTFSRKEGPADELRGDGIDAWLHPKEQSLIALICREYAMPSQEERADFLQSLEVV